MKALTVVTNAIEDHANKQGLEVSRQEAADQADTFLKSFGVWVGFFNKVNGTQVSVASALSDPAMRSLFKDSYNTTRTAVVRPQRMRSTKSVAYDPIHVGLSADFIFAELTKRPNSSRNDLFETTHLRLSTVCSAVNKLMRDGRVVVSGTKIDPITNKTVETLKVRGAK
jgi:hypothetical protein